MANTLIGIGTGLGNILPDDDGLLPSNPIGRIGDRVRDLHEAWESKKIEGLKGLLENSEVMDWIEKYAEDHPEYFITSEEKQKLLDEQNANKDKSIESTNNTKDYETQLKIIEKMEEDQKAMWAREDEIRKHVEEREDNAYQRAVQDMINAGINPAVFGVSAAESGGGITNATKQDYTLLSDYLNNQVEEAISGKKNLTSIMTAIVAIIGVILKFAK